METEEPVKCAGTVGKKHGEEDRRKFCQTKTEAEILPLYY